MIKRYLLFIHAILFYSCNQPSAPFETCLGLKGQEAFTIGKPIQLSTLKIKYEVDEGGENAGKNNHIKDYASVDTTFRIADEKIQIDGALRFSMNEQTGNLISLNCFWPFMINDNEADRIIALKKIKEKLLPCLNIDKLDTKNGGEYTSLKNGRTETFTLTPRFRDGLDATYWTFYYVLK